MSILTKARQAVTDCRCELQAERAEGAKDQTTTQVSHEIEGDAIIFQKRVVVFTAELICRALSFR